MNKLVIVTSSIKPREGSFTYSKSRTVFSPEERFRQTIFTYNSLRNCLPDCKIVILDSSEEYTEYAKLFRFLPNSDFIPIKELSGEIAEIINTHPNKSYCESLLLNTYFKQYKKQIKENDFIFKTSGRYFHFNFNDKLLTEENKDKIFFKKPLEFTWDDNWNYHLTDVRSEENHNFLRQYCTVLYGYGSVHLDKFIDINEATLHFLQQPQLSHYDIETFYYYFTRPYKDLIIETNWLVSGWIGTSGDFMYY